jgi:hypothetical protein
VKLKEDLNEATIGYCRDVHSRTTVETNQKRDGHLYPQKKGVLQKRLFIIWHATSERPEANHATPPTVCHRPRQKRRPELPAAAISGSPYVNLTSILHQSYINHVNLTSILHQSCKSPAATERRRSLTGSEIKKKASPILT